jgi:hypothetical protein
MAVLIVSLNLLEAASLCKTFLHFLYNCI